MSHVRLGVIGLGSMGRRHLETLARLQLGRLSAVATRSADIRAAARAEFGVTAVGDYRELEDLVDAVVVCVPTVLHAEVADFFLERGVHVLVEKPIATTREEATELIETARRSGALLMVGHIERFNPAYLGLQELLQKRGGVQSLRDVVSVQAFRMGPYDGRIQDVGVEHDLMIHDVDAIGGLLPGARLALRTALGMQIITPQTDVAMARLDADFRDGRGPKVNVHVFASRVADAKRRGLRIEHPRLRVELDFLNQTLHMSDGDDSLQPVEVQKEYPLDAELRHFVDCIRRRAVPKVDGYDGLRALEICTAIHSRVGT
ncbi:MAG: Gfo/Idh/MocA family oxidoreductase [Limnochordia bacterium]